MNENHILAEYFLPPLEHPKYKIDDIVCIMWDGEVAWAKITGISEKAGELIYNVLIWTLAGIEEYGSDQRTAFETWIFTDTIIKIN